MLWKKQIIAWRNGAPVRFEDIGTAIDSVENNRTATWLNGKRGIVLSIQRQPGSNTIQIIDEINRIIPRFQQSLPSSVKLTTIYDRSQSIRASVADVQTTLLIAAVLVVLVIFLFLRTLSATLIPSVALPITILGAFAGMSLLGYSLDNLSLMALTLSVGFVVDDAIVMLENIVRHIEEGEAPYEAAVKGAAEIGFTILSMTISLAAVFIPIVFMGGIVGPAAARIRRHHRAHHPDLRLRLGDPDADAVQPLPEGGQVQRAWPLLSVERARPSTGSQQRYEHSLKWCIAPQDASPWACSWSACCDHRPVLYRQGRFHPLGGYRPDPGRHRSRRPRLLRLHGQDAAPDGGHRPEAIPMCRRWCRRWVRAAVRAPAPTPAPCC